MKIIQVITILFIVSLSLACGFTKSVLVDRDHLSDENEYGFEINVKQTEVHDESESEFLDPVYVQIDNEIWVDEFETYLKAQFSEDHIPGMAVSLVSSEGLIYAQGFGLRDVQRNLPVTPDTLFHIGSTQKSMTAMLIASLVDEGTFTWDTPVVELVPEFELSDLQAAQEITFRHLLSMRAGIPAEAEDDLPYEGSLDDVLDAAANARLIGGPGEKFEYSNLSVALAGYLAAAAVYGTDGDIHSAYTKLFEDHILDPIGMNRAAMYLSEAQNDEDFSWSYEVSRSGEARLTETYDIEKDILAPSGSLKASAVEMGYYIQTQLRHGTAPNGQRVVSEENLTETWIPYLEDYAMGWDVKEFDGIKTILHEGAYDDFISVIGFMPEKDIGFVILINSETAGENLILEAPEILAGLLVE